MWFTIGVVLLLWVIYDLVMGSVWSYRRINRSEEPLMYWAFICVWTGIAISCLTPYFMF